MADEEQQTEELQTEQQEQVAEQFAAADEAAAPDTQEQPSYEDIAARIGWVPKDKFKGDEAKWKPAIDYLIDSGSVISSQKRRLKEIQTTLDTVAKTSGAIMAERLQQQHEQLASKYQAAVEKGDPDEAYTLSQQLGDVIERKNESARLAPDSSTLDWIERNPWMKAESSKYDPVAAQRAVQICDQYARANLSPVDQVAKTEAVMRREFPHLFEPSNEKPPPGVSAPTTRVAAQPKRGKTVADMPTQLREYAEDLVERGFVESADRVAKIYFEKLGNA